MSATRILATLCLLAAPLVAQDTTRGVRIGLTYDPGVKPSIVVLRGRGADADSVHAILSRDLDFGDRVRVIPLEASDTSASTADKLPEWPVLASLGATGAVEVTPTATGLHLAVFDVTQQTTALVREYPAPNSANTREWRAVVHGIADDLELAITGTRGIAQTRVLFQRTNRLWIVDSDGQAAVPVTERGIPHSAAWSPNGQMITYANIYSSVMPAQIAVVDIGTGSTRTIASGSGVYISPIFTPDGASVVYSHGVDDGTDLFIVPSAGGTARRLSVGRGSENVSPTLSPDGRRIAFMSSRVGHGEIYSMDADGTNAELLTPVDRSPGALRADPDWSPDGQVIALTSSIAGTLQVMTMSLRNRSLKQLTSTGRNEGPSWAPDGRHLVFTSNRSGVKQLWVLDVPSGRTRQLTTGTQRAQYAAWSPFP